MNSTIKNKQKPCKGIGIAKRYKGCGELSDKRQKGLCPKCYRAFLFSDTEGAEEEKQKFFIQNSKMVTKEKKEAVKKEKQELQEQKRMLNTKHGMRSADDHFSRFIRLTYMDDNCNCTCYTCGDIYPIKETQNGHFMKRAEKSTRYHENNCRPQCGTCNGDTKHNGKQIEFRENLVREIGEEAVQDIEQLSHQSIKADYFFFKEKADYYREKVKEIQKEKGIKIW